MHSLRGFRNIVKAWKIFHYLNLECGIRGGRVKKRQNMWIGYERGRE